MKILENIIYRITGTKRRPTTKIHTQMINMYNKLEKYTPREAKLYGYLEPFENNIKELKENCWNVTLYEYLLNEFRGRRS